MARISVFIDGFNNYYSVKRVCPQYKWLNYHALVEQIKRPEDKITQIYFFTAYPKGKNAKDKRLRHQLYLKVLETVNVQAMISSHMRKPRYCPLGGKFWTYEEKQTDVHIAVRLLEDAFNDKFDTAIVISADTDLVPAINTFKRLFHRKRIGVILPVSKEKRKGKKSRKANALEASPHFAYHLIPGHLRKSQFPLNVTLLSGKQVSCPPEWQNPQPHSKPKRKVPACPYIPCQRFVPFDRA